MRVCLCLSICLYTNTHTHIYIYIYFLNFFLNHEISEIYGRVRFVFFVFFWVGGCGV